MSLPRAPRKHFRAIDGDFYPVSMKEELKRYVASKSAKTSIKPASTPPKPLAESVQSPGDVAAGGGLLRQEAADQRPARRAPATTGRRIRYWNKYVWLAAPVAEPH